GFVEGFVLAPSPAVDSELALLLDSPTPSLVAVAIDVLGARGSLPVDAPERVLSRRDAVLTKKLASALGRALPKTNAIRVLVDLLDDEPDDDLFGVVATSLLRRGDGAVRQRLRDAIIARGSRVAIATKLLALSGRPEDCSLLLDGAKLALRADVVDALGRYGHVNVIPVLIETLASEDDEIVAAAATALDFITNAGLRETVQEPWAGEGAAPDDAPAATRPVSKPVKERLRWHEWHNEARGRLDPRLKLRAGRPFVPSMIVDELVSTAPPARRADAALELVIATNVGTRFSTTDWCKRQKEQLSELGAHLRSLDASAAGAFWFAGAPTVYATSI
ncbi:MAG TPA: hypothetical protein VM580_01660, partial [Labilithrix sp.]|nr:hypothetical protein [Labilithrix sp.]